MFLKKFRIKINKDTWTVRLLSDKVFKALYPGCDGITHYHHPKGLREITFRQKYRDVDTIVHELIHAYLSYYDFSQMSYGAIEEKFCEILGKKMGRITQNSQTVYRKLRLRSLRRSKIS